MFHGHAVEGGVEVKVTIKTDDGMTLFMECEKVTSNTADIASMLFNTEAYKVQCNTVTLENVTTTGAEFDGWEPTDD